jgi:hypothetical protein
MKLDRFSPVKEPPPLSDSSFLQILLPAPVLLLR